MATHKIIMTLLCTLGTLQFSTEAAIDPSYYKDIPINESEIDDEIYTATSPADDFFDDEDEVEEDDFSGTSEENNIIRKSSQDEGSCKGAENQVHLDVEPSSIVNKSVNVITGHYMDWDIDFEIPGAEAFILQRNYLSGSNNEWSPLGDSWSHNYFANIDRFKETEKKLKYRATVYDASGSVYEYGYRKKHRFEMLPETYKNAVTNCASGFMSRHTNIKNNALEYQTDGTCILRKSSGENLRLTPFRNGHYSRLTEEEKPNGNRLRYFYNMDKKLAKIETLGRHGNLLDTLEFKYSESDKESYIFINRGSQHKAIYRLEEMSGLKVKDCKNIVEAVRANRPTVNYIYENKYNAALSPKIIRKNMPEGRFQEIRYYKKGYNCLGQDFNLVRLHHNTNLKMERVKQQKAPVGSDATPIVTHSYFYHISKTKKGSTEVYDAYKHLTKYHWDTHLRLTSIDRYQGNNSYQLYNREKLFWGKVGTDACTFLLSRACENADGKVEFVKTYKYDEYGNVLFEILYGNLSGKNQAACAINEDGTVLKTGCEQYKKSFTYSPDGRNLLSMTENGVTQTFKYKEGTCLLTAKLYSYQDKIFKREFYTFDENGVLIEEIEDDGTSTSRKKTEGATERRIRTISVRNEFPIGLPEVVEDKYIDLETGCEHLIKKTIHFYCDQGRLIAQKLYDANNKFLCKLTWDYDAHGNVIRETNPLGHETIRRYDANDNKVYEKGPATNFHKEFFYDFSNRLVKVDEVHSDGKLLSESYAYDYLNHKVSSTDIYGNETRYVYDDFGRLTKTILPAIVSQEGSLKFPENSKEYNIFNVPQFCSDFKGNFTTIDYTIRGKPTRTIYPDGTSDEFEYNLDGTVKTQTHKNGSFTDFEYDHLKRLTKKKTCSKNNKELETLQYKYNTFHLLSETDAAGNVKQYRYNPAGYLVETTKGENRITYDYDAIGRLYKTTEHNGSRSSVSHIQVFDLLDRVIKERQEDSDGNRLTKVTYGYDQDGNRNSITTYSDKGKSTTTTIYDARHQPIQIIDPNGNITHIAYKYDYTNEYGQIVPYSISTDPLGNITENIKDTHGRLACLIQKNSMGERLHKRLLFYDLNGNKCRQEEWGTKGPGKRKKPIITAWTYDCMNQVTGTTEAVGRIEQKQTELHYNLFGEKYELIKADNVKILHKYDALGRLKSHISSDGTINYKYSYDANGNVLKIKDRIHDLLTHKEYDSLNRLIKDTLANGLSISYSYDGLNQPQTITFPDQTGLEYIYNGKRLMEIHRLSKKGKRQYSHRYIAYDLQDKLTQAELIGKAGKARYTYDIMGRAENLHYKSWNESISSYDEVGNIMARAIKEPHQTTHCSYTYDDLYQINEENGVAKHSYGCDSLNNRIKKDGKTLRLNGLNQLLSDSKTQYSYDPNGNLIKKNSDHETLFDYDALDRLVAVTTGNIRTCYTYDAQNRRISKRTDHRAKRNKSWKSGETINFLYLGQNEVGTYDSKGVALELRLLGISHGAEIGAAVAIELRGEVYAPLHDHVGNVAALVDAKSGKAIEYYRYSAFGEEFLFDAESNQIETSINPWRFAGKRVDPETGFIYFGRRYYEPATGRWMTPDPIGYDDGPNLYAYVKNRPLTVNDPYGLFGFDGFGETSFARSTFGQYCFSAVGYIGNCIELVATHFVPVPLVREFMQASGRLMSGRGFTIEHSIGRGVNSYGHLGRDEPINKDGYWCRIIIVGGICTTKEDMRLRALALSDSLEGVNVHYYASATDGCLIDLVKAGVRSFGIQLPADQNFADMAYHLSDEVGPQGTIYTKVHSQGGMVLDNFRDYSTLDGGSSSSYSRVAKKMDVASFGSARILLDENYNSASNYISNRDIVPLVGNPRNYCQALVQKRNDVIFLKSKGLPFLDHGWDTKTYQDANKLIDNEIRGNLKRSL